ncbi:DeoR/GlpR family DNA-binding transcription regulator [Litorihabitans aurantiacus]|uniref:DeoR family transcriptional regulator n=1 Tax=Litorihabitans aurantiacus TaxID=1930061 RepID=A0AA37XFA4_9MICO|nr:DeoR/GlpR family DNA-binding transcription regulator [Litorihabitans aurantiacus]GMA32176.1 DeoR family transcriptional regulator [Litorihabitans aurantiacus]
MDTPLLADQRRAVIRDAVARAGAVRMADLVARLGVSEMTIRRDIAALAELGVLSRVHGGAVARTGSATEPAFTEKATRAGAQKTAIARAVADLVPAGTSLGLTAGTTTAAVATALTRLPHVATLSVLTNSPPAADILFAQPHAPTLVVTGGEPTPSAALVGPVAASVCSTFHLDTLVLGVSGMDAAAGLTSPTLAEADTLAAFLRASSRVVVAADSSKWGTTALRTIAGWDAVDVLVTDDGLPADALEHLRDVVDVRLATTPEGPR